MSFLNSDDGATSRVQRDGWYASKNLWTQTTRERYANGVVDRLHLHETIPRRHIDGAASHHLIGKTHRGATTPTPQLRVRIP